MHAAVQNHPALPAAPPVDYQPRRADRPLPVRYMPQLDALRRLPSSRSGSSTGASRTSPASATSLGATGRLALLRPFRLPHHRHPAPGQGGRRPRRRRGASGAHAARSDPPGAAVRSFYARRFLRILPIYYLTLFATVFVLHMPGVRRGVLVAPDLYDQLPRGPGRPVPRPGRRPLLDAGGRGAVLPALAGADPAGAAAAPRPDDLPDPPRRRRVPRRLCADGQRGAASVWPFGCFDLFAFGAALAAFGDDARYERRGPAFCRWCGRLGGPALAALLALAFWHRARAGPVAPSLAVNLVLNSLAAGALFAWLIARTARGFGGVGQGGAGVRAAAVPGQDQLRPLRLPQLHADPIRPAEGARAVARVGDSNGAAVGRRWIGPARWTPCASGPGSAPAPPPRSRWRRRRGIWWKSRSTG